jgi:DNA end-binding protein Ku
MPPHSVGTGTISFGLVSIPVRLYTATSSANVSFNLLHAKCGSRIRQQTFCPVCNATIDRSDLEGEASKNIDITEFVPLDRVDPIYFERTYYLGPDKGGEKAYRLLADAMAKTERVALAKFVMRGKESLVLIRAARDGLLLHTMYFADEVRDFAEIDRGQSAKIKGGELELAQQLIEGLSNDQFKPEEYQDEYRGRVLDLINRKVEGQEVTVSAPPQPRAQVIDLMEALKESLAARTPASASETRKPPVRVTKRAEPARAPARKAQGGKK